MYRNQPMSVNASILYKNTALINEKHGLYIFYFFLNSKIDGARTARDDRRRATHNEVERRRRDKINNWIVRSIQTCTRLRIRPI